MIFSAKISATFEADDIDNALAVFACHFLTLAVGGDPSTFLPGSLLEIKPAVDL